MWLYGFWWVLIALLFKFSTELQCFKFSQLERGLISTHTDEDYDEITAGCSCLFSSFCHCRIIMRRKSFGNTDLSLSCGQTKVECPYAIHHTAHTLCKGICVSSLHCLRVFVWEGENYLNTLLVHACLFVCLSFFFSKKIFVLKNFGIRVVRAWEYYVKWLVGEKRKYRTVQVILHTGYWRRHVVVVYLSYHNWVCI